MCTPEIIAAAPLITAGAAATTAGAAIYQASQKPSKPPKIKPPPDLRAEEKRRQLRSVQATIKGAPGTGRKATQNVTPPAALGFKTRTGQ